LILQPRPHLSANSFGIEVSQNLLIQAGSWLERQEPQLTIPAVEDAAENRGLHHHGSTDLLFPEVTLPSALRQLSQSNYENRSAARAPTPRADIVPTC
jgi:hypothetical protein